MKHLTWRDIRDYLNGFDEDKLNETATVWLDDMVWMMDYGGTAGDYPISNINEASIFIDDGYWCDEEEDEEG